jgi:hypothetical protein
MEGMPSFTKGTISVLIVRASIKIMCVFMCVALYQNLSLYESDVFFLRPLAFHQGRVQVVGPPLPTLLANPSWDFISNKRPFCYLRLHTIHDDFVLLLFLKKRRKTKNQQSTKRKIKKNIRIYIFNKCVSTETSAVQLPLISPGRSTFCHRCTHCTSERLPPNQSTAIFFQFLGPCMFTAALSAASSCREMDRGE